MSEAEVTLTPQGELYFALKDDFERREGLGARNLTDRLFKGTQLAVDGSVRMVDERRCVVTDDGRAYVAFHNSCSCGTFRGQSRGNEPPILGELCAHVIAARLELARTDPPS